MKRKKILIIEDEMIHGVFLKSSIESSGYHVFDILSKGEDAIIAAINYKPDLIITDILLKGKITGIEAVEEILRHINIPFIFLTALNDCVVIDRATRIAPYAIINKPYDVKALIEVIDSLLK